MADIVLTTLNARYWHSSFGLRYLLANMNELTDRTVMLEFGVSERTVDVVAAILKHEPIIVGIGVYIWNVDAVSRLVSDLRQVRPDLQIVLGGPEVSYDHADLAFVGLADYVIAGEGDRAFPALCRQLLAQPAADTVSVQSAAVSDTTSSEPRETGAFEANGLPMLAGSGPSGRDNAGPQLIRSGVVDLATVALPYHLYTDEDIAHRVIYVEISRGCPFTCEFCLSALNIPVRMFDVDAFLQSMQLLLDRGALQFKFVDRTFNLNLRVSQQILEFFLRRYRSGIFLHFEMIPDRLPETLRRLIAEFPAGSLQFEIGVQTFNDQVGRLISRRQDNDRLEDNFRFLREHTGVHIHADLIVGLPGESLESFAAGFDRLVSLDPHEIQVGMLKRLRGTPMTRHDSEWQMVYSRYAPYEILCNRLIGFDTMQRLRRFARYWDLVANSGNFRGTLPLLWGSHSPFERFLAFSDWLYNTEERAHSLSLQTLTSRLFEYLVQRDGAAADEIAMVLLKDYQRGGRRDIPACLRPYVLTAKADRRAETPSDLPDQKQKLPPRQTRHRD